METVRDAEGTRYLLVKRSGASSRVRDIETGRERYLPNDRLEPTTGSALSAVGREIPTAVRERMERTREIHDDRTLGLLCEIRAREPVGVLELLDEYDLCESDLSGALSELQAARLIEPAVLDGIAMPGDRGYRTTEAARDALSERSVGPDGGEID